MTYRDHVSTETLADHAEGLLGESEAGQVAAHLEDCEACRSEALLLVSLQEILRADEVGPMPAEYATRIDAVLADLVAAEPLVRLKPGGTQNPEAVPILNAPAEADAGGAKVIDLATRRKVMMTGLRRVGTVAAGVVLLIGGAALGVRTLGNNTDLVPTGPSHEAISPARSFDKLPTAPATAVKRKHGIKVDEKTGWIYTPSGKVLLPDGTVVLPGPTKNDPPTVIEPKKSSGGVQTVVPPKKSGGKSVKPPSKPSKQGPNAAAAPGDTAAPNASAPPAARPAATTAPTSPAGDGGQHVGITSTPRGGAKSSQAAKDTYVTQSGSEYTEDNFAGKVRDLLTQASHDSSTPGSYQSSSAGAPRPDPTPGPTAGPSPSYSPAAYQQNLPTSYHQVDMPPAGPGPGRGPADPEVKSRVQRCAAQLGTTAIAGDEGMWGGRKATVIVVPTQDNPNQVIGYVFYGNCTKYNPATPDTAQWEQRVDKPAPATNAQSAPVQRVGGTSPDSDVTTSELLER
jgi:hypothetical protein